MVGGCKITANDHNGIIVEGAEQSRDRQIVMKAGKIIIDKSWIRQVQRK